VGSGRNRVIPRSSHIEKVSGGFFMPNYLVLKFTGKPISKDNLKLVSKYPSKKTGKHYTILSAKYKNYEKDLKEQARSQLPKGFKPYECNVWISLFLHFKDRRHGDILNLPKSICDAMQGVLYKNDKQCWLDKVFPVYNGKEGFTMSIIPVEHGKPTSYHDVVKTLGKYIDSMQKKQDTLKEILKK